MENLETAKQIIWWKDLKLLTGIILVILSVIIGFFSKIYVVAKIYEPIAVITGLSVYALSWIMLFFGAFLLGWETVRLIQQRIRHHVQHTVETTYHHARELPKKSYHYTKELHKRGMEKIRKSMAK
ncbi:hypothetical protein J4480_06675 [Candidatus Woesearchaeota archaeon]|nr:hypothetical protein [Candidatus Woesearchaeota archaeon]